MKGKRPVVLIIRDGWGYREDANGNAVAAAHTPFQDWLASTCPRSLLDASGEAVGLLEGMCGNSEVNHANMGAGRIMRQDVRRIHDAIADKSFFANRRLKIAFERCAGDRHAVHLFGILQDAGVHAHIRHVEALLEMAHTCGAKKVYLHVFADGRDSPQRSVASFIERLPLSRVRIASMAGRFYLDRGGNYDLTRVAYFMMVHGEGKRFSNVDEALAHGYGMESPDGGPMTDEYLPACVFGDFSGIREGDSVVFFHFRQDRAVQIARAFEEQRWGGPEVYFVGMTKYYDEFEDFAFAPSDEVRAGVGEVMSGAGMRQMRIADSQKFRHVTSFFNGKRIAPYAGEDRVEIALPHPDQYRARPQQGAYEIAEAAAHIIRAGVYDFILINFANCDNVGHTADEAATRKAVEAVDACTKRVAEAAWERGGIAFITADHGNAEEIRTPSGEPHAAHTRNPVEFFYTGPAAAEVRLRPQGILPDIAPTILEAVGISPPADMSACSLFSEQKDKPA